jgi:O-succinylbenzoic acid--CoA ligase
VEPKALVEMRIHPRFSYNGIPAHEIASFIEKTFREWERPAILFMREWLNAEETIEVQTSGSSGEPTVWRTGKSALEASASMTANFFHRPSGTSALLVLPATYIAGKMMLVRAMTQGWSLTSIMPSAQPLSTLKHPFDFAAFTPMQLAELNDDQFKLLAQFGTVIVGGAAVSDALRERLVSYCDNIYETYGMAETLSHIAVRRLSGQNMPFEALESVQLSVDTEHRLQISAPHILPEIIQTQDVVELLSPSAFYYRGRYDRMINSGGVKLFAEVIEKKIEPFMDRPYHISSLPDDILGRRLVLYIESEVPIDETKLKERITVALDRYEVPKEIIVVQTLERTSSGKIKQIKH